MTRPTSPAWFALVAVAVASAAAGATATLGALLDEGVVSACRSKTTGVLRVPGPGGSCKSDEQPLQWNVRGPAGPAGRWAPAGRGCSIAGAARPSGTSCRRPERGARLSTCSGRR